MEVVADVGVIASCFLLALLYAMAWNASDFSIAAKTFGILRRLRRHLGVRISHISVVYNFMLLS